MGLAGYYLYSKYRQVMDEVNLIIQETLNGPPAPLPQASTPSRDSNQQQSPSAYNPSPASSAGKRQGTYARI